MTNKFSWHSNAVLFVAIFSIVITLYSAFNLNGVFVADFFKNNILNITSGLGFIPYVFFGIKVLMSIFLITAKSPIKKLMLMSGLFMFFMLEGIVKVGYSDCYGCETQPLVNVWSSLIIVIAFMIIVIPQFKMTNQYIKLMPNK